MKALDRIYVVLDQQDKACIDRLCERLQQIFLHVNLTSNLYLVSNNLSEGMPLVKHIQRIVKTYLKQNRFARMYVHFVHGLASATIADIDHDYQYYYQSWKRSTLDFDREGYAHQEIPRLMLLPVIVPHQGVAPTTLARLTGLLKKAFMMPGLYLDGNTLSFAQNDELRHHVEKLYYGIGDSGELANVVCSLCYQAIVEELTTKLESQTGLVEDPCAPLLIMSAKNGSLYGCVEQFVQGKSLGDIHGSSDATAVLDQFVRSSRSQRACLACKEQAIASCINSPLPKETVQELGALLYRFGAMRQEAGDNDQAIKNLKISLQFSPPEEAGAIQFRLGLCYLAMGRHDKAVKALKDAEPAYNNEHFLHFYLGICFFEQRDYLQAVDAFKRASNLLPPAEDHMRILIYLGTCYNNLQRYRDAIGPLEKAINLEKNVKEIYSILGYSYFQLKDYDRAIDSLKMAVELDPDSAIDYASLGANYRDKGNVEAAVGMFRKALELDPGLDVARENMNRLAMKHE